MNRQKGLVHIYCGDGKGKTTAAEGLALRCAGSGGSVVFYQFLKDGKSSEIPVLRSVDGITVFDGPEQMKFTFQLTEEEKKELSERYAADFRTLTEAARESSLLVLDEVLHAVNLGFLPLETLTEFLDSRPEGLEIVLTGRDPAAELRSRADYITDMRKIKHPYDSGTEARRGIEF